MEGGGFLGADRRETLVQDTDQLRPILADRDPQTDLALPQHPLQPEAEDGVARPPELQGIGSDDHIDCAGQQGLGQRRLAWQRDRLDGRLGGQQIAHAQDLLQIPDSPAGQAREPRRRQRVAVAQVEKEANGVEVLGEQETIAPLGQRRGQHQTIDPAALGRGDHLMPRTGLEPDLDAELVAEQPQIVHGKAGDTPLPDRNHVGRPLSPDAEQDPRVGVEPGTLGRGQQVRAGAVRDDDLGHEQPDETYDENRPDQAWKSHAEL